MGELYDVAPRARNLVGDRMWDSDPHVSPFVFAAWRRFRTWGSRLYLVSCRGVETVESLLA